MKNTSKYIFDNLNSRKDLPDAMHLGPMRTGSTWLQYCLSDHPDIRCVQNKTFLVDHPHYPDIPAKYDEVLNKYNYELKPNFRDIVPLLGKSPDILVQSNEKLLTFGRFKIMSRLNPDVKLLAVLREPTARYLSHIDRVVAENQNHNQLAEELFRDRHNYVSMGYYEDQIRNLTNYFDESQIYLYQFSDLRSNSYEFLQRIWGDLEVNESYIPEDVDIARNSGETNDGRSSTPVSQLSQNIERFNHYNPELIEEIHTHYSEKNNKLSELVPFCIDIWNKPPIPRSE